MKKEENNYTSKIKHTFNVDLRFNSSSTFRSDNTPNNEAQKEKWENQSDLKETNTKDNAAV